MNISVFALHGGSDLHANIDCCKKNETNAKASLVISNICNSMALERAKNEKISCYHLSAKMFERK